MKRYLRLAALLAALSLASACGPKDAGISAPPPPPPPPKAEEPSFRLEKGETVAVRLFAAPASAKTDHGDLPALFHDQLAFALHEAGLHAEDAPAGTTPSPAGPTAAPLSGQDGKNPEQGTDEAGPESAANAAGPETPRYILSGRITSYRTWASSPARASGGARTRVDAETACVYRLQDAETGKTLISGTARGSGVRTTTSGNPEDAGGELAHKVLSAMAESLAGRLTGRTAGPGAAHLSGDEGSDYRDSPGKRLRPSP